MRCDARCPSQERRPHDQSFREYTKPLPNHRRVRTVDNQKLIDDVNKSGFPLQIAIGHHIEETHREHGWKIEYKEHAWKNVADGNEGFLDLAIRNAYATSMLVIECKRVLDASWVFLVNDEKQMKRRRAKPWANYMKAAPVFSYAGWADIALDPATPQSEFCVVSSSKEGKATLKLEPIAAELLSATEALANEEGPIQIRTLHELSMYFGVIVTTAKLKVCTVKPEAISLAD